MQRITRVAKGSVCSRIGVRAGDALISINGTPVLDIIDYQYFSAEEKLLLRFLSADGQAYEADVEKEAGEPLGLDFETGLMSPVRSCKNHCLFCFIDQMPKGGRETLSFKDDDWRMSFIMGNYVTLTNIDDAEFQRILSRRVSPLYISVHATDPEVRVKMMRNPTAGKLMERLKALQAAGLCFHSQIVCCPEINDGPILQRSMEELGALYPAARSLAVVPVGLTKYREGLAPLRIFEKEEAKAVLRRIEAFASRCRAEMGTSFVFPADELVLEAGEELPPYEAYEDFPQIENGVGLLRLFEREFLDALEEKTPLLQPYFADAVGGVMAHPFMRGLFQKLEQVNIHMRLHAVRNEYFGPSVNVGGLLTGQDILRQVKGKLHSNTLLLPHNMLREGEDVFLDGMTVEALAGALGVAVAPVRGEGEAWVEALFRLAEEAQ